MKRILGFKFFSNTSTPDSKTVKFQLLNIKYNVNAGEANVHP